MFYRGFRGATTCSKNTAIAIYDATLELITTVLEKNNIHHDHIISILLSMSPDLNAAFPAAGLRKDPTFHDTPLFCMQEIAVPHAPKYCIRTLIHASSSLEKKDVIHIYLHNFREWVKIETSLKCDS